MTFGVIGSNQTRGPDQRMVFSLAVRLLGGGAEVAGCVCGAEVALAVVSVVEVPGLAGFDQLAAAAAVGLAGGDEWLELSAAGDVGVGVAACVPAQLALLPGRAHPGSRTP
jgi:hypothetical protein